MSNRLAEVRREKGLAIRGLTARTGVSASTICAVERWNYCPTALTRERIAEGLGVPVSAIWPDLPDASDTPALTAAGAGR